MANWRRWALVLIASAALTTTGCTMAQSPTYNTVSEETQAAMQRIVDEMPPGTRVSPRPEQEPYGCDGDSVLYTGHWDVFAGPGFDGQKFVDELPDALAEDFVEEQTGLDLDFPAVSFIATGYGNTGINVSVGEVDGETVVDILATSRCAQPPSTQAP